MPGMQEASMKLTESLHEVYEPDWYGREDVKMVGEVRPGWQHTGGLGAGGRLRGSQQGHSLSLSLTSAPPNFSAQTMTGRPIPRRHHTILLPRSSQMWLLVN